MKKKSSAKTALKSSSPMQNALDVKNVPAIIAYVLFFSSSSFFITFCLFLIPSAISFLVNDPSILWINTWMQPGVFALPLLAAFAVTTRELKNWKLGLLGVMFILVFRFVYTITGANFL